MHLQIEKILNSNIFKKKSYFFIGDSMKKIFNLFKKILFSFVILYGFNTIGINFNLIIPINLITLTLITFLGFPALFSLVLLFVLAF